MLERVALLHSYLEKGDGTPDNLMRIGILAAAQKYRSGEIDKICITVEHSLAEAQIKRLKALLRNIPDEDIVSTSSTVTTKGEVAAFFELAKKHSWGELTSIGNGAHLPRIKRDMANIFGNAEVDVADSAEILNAYPRYQGIVKDMPNWPEQKALVLQEKVLGYPVIGRAVLALAPYLSHFKVVLQTWGLKQIKKLT